MNVTKEEIQTQILELSGWSFDGEVIRVEYVFSDFKEAFAFMSLVAIEAEKMEHHPSWSNEYNKVNISLSTHDEGSVTECDIELARNISHIVKRFI